MMVWWWLLASPFPLLNMRINDETNIGSIIPKGDLGPVVKAVSEKKC